MTHHQDTNSMKQDTYAKIGIAIFTVGLIYIGYCLGDMAAEPTRAIMASLRTKQANGTLVIDHCAQHK